MFSSFQRDIGIDLGTANVLIYKQGKGVVLDEPSVVAFEKKTKKLIAVGKDAKDMLGRSPQNITVVKPLRKGVISDYGVALKMLRHYINISCGRRRFFRPRIMVCVPGCVTTVEKKAVIDAAREAGGNQIFLIDEPTAAAIGAGLDISAPDGQMIVDIGGGTTDIAVLSLGGCVASNSIKVAGETFNLVIQRHIKKEYGILIGESTAEEIKISTGSVIYGDENKVDCRGRHLVTGLPENVEISSNSLVAALQEPLTQIVEAVHHVFEITPPEIAADIYHNGITLTGGGALLKGLDVIISEHVGVPCYIADDPQECVAKGTGVALDMMDKFSQLQVYK